MNLPGEVLHEIFSYFSLDKIIEFRKVCKQFRNTVDLMKFNELSIFVNQFPFNETICFNTNEEINLNYSLKVRSLDFLKLDYFKNKFRSLKRLFIFINQHSKLSICLEESNLNYYQNLELLELHNVYYLTNCLKLDNLKYLSIDTIVKCDFKLKCNNLIYLSLDGEGKADCLETKSINYVESPSILKNFDLFQNLRTFTIYKLNEIDLSWIVNLLNLKEIKIYSVKKRQYLDNLIEKKQIYNLNNLKILFGGINIENIDTFNSLCSIFEYLFSNQEYWSCNFLTTRLLRFYIRNLEQLDEHLNFVEYLEIENDFDESIIIKLINLKTLYINQCIGNHKFNLLIRNCKKLKYVQFYSSELDQLQFNLIPFYLRNLRHLEFKKCNLASFQFVSELKNLEFFGSNQQDFNLNELKNIILNCNLLRTIKLQCDDETFFINLINFNIKHLTQIYEFNCLDKLIKHIDNCNNLQELIIKIQL